MVRPLLILALLCLSAAAAAGELVATPGAAKPGPGKDGLVCRRETPVGSLIASRKVCLTKAEWDARARDGNETARKLVYDNMGRPSGN